MLGSNKKYDPSEDRQVFEKFSFKIHCCRYWKLSDWECTDMAIPFWRIYYNKIEGARIIFNNTEFSVTQDKIIIIPPNTSYSNTLRGKPGTTDHTEKIMGSMITHEDTLEKIRDMHMVDHLFIHFNLGIPYDLVNPGIYEVDASPDFKQTLEAITAECIDLKIGSFSSHFKIISLITGLLIRLPENIWIQTNIDSRIKNVVTHISKNFDKNLQNNELSKISNLATNSFARLFKSNLGESVQSFIKKVRIENALLLMHHSNLSIDTISFRCGFSDRYHFTKSFKQVVGISPAAYKKMKIYRFSNDSD